MHSEDSESASKSTFKAPELPYAPRDPKSYQPGIGLIGCGAITVEHLAAYQKASYRVVGLCDLDRENAEKRQSEFFPDAKIYTDHHDLLAQDTIEVVDIATHPEVRPKLIEDSLLAGKHVLSQKPFVLDLDEGVRLVKLAETQNKLLAVNQNGRWAPHFSYIRQAVEQGLIGTPYQIQMGVHWDHNWVKDTPFNEIHHLILFDFAIHWFDILTCFMGQAEPTKVFASLASSPTQQATPPLMAQIQVEYPGALASLVFNGDLQHGELDTTFLAGTKGSISSTGVDINKQTVTLHVGEESDQPQLSGNWFPNAFRGTMGELLCAIEEKRVPNHNAKDNLRSLELCFAAVESAERGVPVVPGSVRKMPGT